MKPLFFMVLYLGCLAGCGNINPASKGETDAGTDVSQLPQFPPRAVLAQSDSSEAEIFAGRKGLLPSDSILVDELPHPVHIVPPQYPPDARKNGTEGVVYLYVWITADGDVKNAVALGSSDNIFVDPALASVKKWKFSQAQANGRGVAVSVIIPLRFKL